MISYEKAKELALGCWSEVDYCMEHGDAYVFSKKDDYSIGGNGPVVVLKDSGRCINFVGYINMDGNLSELVREGYIEDL